MSINYSPSGCIPDNISSPYFIGFSTKLILGTNVMYNGSNYNAHDNKYKYLSYDTLVGIGCCDLNNNNVINDHILNKCSKEYIVYLLKPIIDDDILRYSTYSYDVLFLSRLWLVDNTLIEYEIHNSNFYHAKYPYIVLDQECQKNNIKIKLNSDIHDYYTRECVNDLLNSNEVKNVIYS